MRKSNHGNADDEGKAAQNHQRLAAHPVGEQPGEEGRDHAAEQYGRDDDRKLTSVESGGCLQIGQRAADDADVYAVKQAAQTRDQQEEAIVCASFAADARQGILLLVQISIGH